MVRQLLEVGAVFLVVLKEATSNDAKDLSKIDVVRLFVTIIKSLMNQ